MNVFKPIQAMASNRQNGTLLIFIINTPSSRQLSDQAVQRTYQLLKAMKEEWPLLSSTKNISLHRVSQNNTTDALIIDKTLNNDGINPKFGVGLARKNWR